MLTNIIIIIFLSFYNIKRSRVHFIFMKTEPSYLFQHSLLTREVFILHTRYFDILILKNSH